MSRSGIVVAVDSVGVIGLAIGYGAGVAFNRSPDPPVGPIELDGPLPRSTAPVSVPANATSATSPAVVPPPTLGPTPSRPQPVNVAPTSAVTATPQPPST